MAEIKGKLTICDRCGGKVFLKAIGEGDMDSGFTRWTNFEKVPEDWGWHSDTGMLCPKCNKEYHEMLKNFKNRIGEQNG